jgi:bifunctional DNA-binding transcriptional regulator/antitoxin component of YhaV-PrlF toxin-antitoxin module
MNTTLSSKGLLVMPAEIRRLDDLQPGQTFEVERIERGTYRLVLKTPLPNEGVVDWLRRHERDLAVRNTRDFKKAGVTIIDPFA